MMKIRKYILSIIVLFLVINNNTRAEIRFPYTSYNVFKSVTQSTETISGNLKKRLDTEYFIFYCSDKDTSVLKDIRKALDANCEKLKKELDCKYPYKITLLIYPDQNAFDESLIDKSVAGAPACSGNRRIQMVSPSEPIRIEGIQYEERLLMAVHEYVHLMLNEINNSLPVWIQEGVASYFGSPGGYDAICKIVMGRLSAISFNDLETNYHGLPAPDIYSYLAISYIIDIYGMGVLNSVIKDPGNMKKILSKGYESFDLTWHEYIDKKYRK
jgi:hypothetical protein